MKSLALPVTRRKNKISLLENERGLMFKTNERLIKWYRELKTAVRRSEGKGVKSIATSVVGMAMCVRRKTTKCGLREIHELDYLSERGRPKQT